MEPFMQLFRQTAMLLLKTPSPNPSLTTPASNYVLIAQAMVLLVDIYYDLTCQDLPPAVEDSHEEFFGPSTGWFQAFLLWDPEDIRVDVGPFQLGPLDILFISFTYSQRKQLHR
jgi:exportin-2 (importin alpha re-exporter)